MGEGPLLEVAGGHAGEGFGDLAVAALGGVLVAERGVDAAVAESLLELGEGGAGHGGHRRARVAEVVKAEIGAPGKLSRDLPVLVERRGRQA